MDFQDRLRSFIGESVQVVTGFDVISGLLLGVTDTTVTVRAASTPGYGSGQTVVYQLDRITYVRIV